MLTPRVNPEILEILNLETVAISFFSPSHTHFQNKLEAQGYSDQKIQ